MDDDQAKQTVVGQLFASAIHTLAISVKLTHDSGYFDISPVAGLGIDDVRIAKAVLVGDQLKVKVTIVALRESKSRPEVGVITNQTELINQNGEVVVGYSLSGLINKRPQ